MFWPGLKEFPRRELGIGPVSYLALRSRMIGTIGEGSTSRESLRRWTDCAGNFMAVVVAIVGVG